MESYPEVDVDVEECSDVEESPTPKKRKSHHTNRHSKEGRESSSPEPVVSWMQIVPRNLNDLIYSSNQPQPKIRGSCNCDELLPIQCHLETKELWDKFNEFETEMIITKTGR